MIKFTVYGKAQTAGSKRAFVLRRKDGTFVTRPGGSPVVNVTDDNARSKEWRNAVAWTARKAYQGPLLDGPLMVKIVIWRPRPKGHFLRNGGLSKEGIAMPMPTSKPDLLKHVRALEDSLTGVVWRDDSQIVEQVHAKYWGEPARVEVQILAWEGPWPKYHGPSEPEPF